MTILAKFPLGTFNTSNKLNHDFNYYYEMAERGAKHYKEDLVSNILAILVIIVPIASIFIIALKTSTNNNSLNFGKTGNKVPNNVPLFRDIPCKHDIFRAYFIAYNYKLMKNKTDFLGAILLKWLKEDKIKIEKQEARKNN